MNLHDVTNLTRRRGTWRVQSDRIHETLNGDPETRAAWHAVFGEAVIVAAEYRWGGLEVKYTGYHPAFDELPEGVKEPEYEAFVTRNTEGHTISFTAEWKKRP